MLRLALYSQIRTVPNMDGEPVHLFTKRDEAIAPSYGRLRKATPSHVTVAHVATRKAGKEDMNRYLAAARR